MSSLLEEKAYIEYQLERLQKHVFSGKPMNKGAKKQEKKLRQDLDKIRQILFPPRKHKRF